MKSFRVSAILAACAFLISCAGLPEVEAPARRVSHDYTASGALSGVRAFVYGKRTVLEFDSPPAFLSVRDSEGVSVGFEKEGGFYRLARKLEAFTISASGQILAFALKPASDPIAANPAPVKLAAAPQPITAEDRQASELLEVARKQLDEIKSVLAAAKGKDAKAEDIRRLNARLDSIESRLADAATVVLRVTFESGKADFRPNSDVSSVLILAAQSAERINVRGRTDSRAAGPVDAKIARARALSARLYLIEKGIKPEKIKVFWLTAGDFVAPHWTNEGKALNRRVKLRYSRANRGT